MPNFAKAISFYKWLFDKLTPCIYLHEITKTVLMQKLRIVDALVNKNKPSDVDKEINSLLNILHNCLKSLTYCKLFPSRLQIIQILPQKLADMIIDTSYFIVKSFMSIL